MAFREENQRARREVELASVRDSTTTPIVGVSPAAPTPRPASLPWPLPGCLGDEPQGWCPRAPEAGWTVVAEAPSMAWPACWTNPSPSSPVTCVPRSCRRAPAADSPSEPLALPSWTSGRGGRQRRRRRGVRRQPELASTPCRSETGATQARDRDRLALSLSTWVAQRRLMDPAAA